MTDLDLFYQVLTIARSSLKILMRFSSSLAETCVIRTPHENWHLWAIVDMLTLIIKSYKYWLIILQCRFLLCTLFDTFSCRFSNICKQKWRFFPRKLKKCEFYRIDQEFFDILSNFLLTNRLLFLPRKLKHFDKRNEDFTDYPDRIFTFLQKYSHT